MGMKRLHGGQRAGAEVRVRGSAAGVVPGATAAAVGAVALAVPLLAACGGGHRLAEYDLTDRPVGVVSYAPAYPVLWTGELRTGDPLGDPVGAVLEAGSSVATEVGGRRARARLDSASARVDVVGDLTGRTLTRASRYLGGRPVDDPGSADFLLEVDVRRFGIDARRPGYAYLFLDARTVLLESATGHEIWREEVRARDRLTPLVRSGDGVPAGAVTAGVLETLSVEDFERILGRLVTFSSDVLTDELRDELREVRRDRRRSR